MSNFFELTQKAQSTVSALLSSGQTRSHIHSLSLAKTISDSLGMPNMEIKDLDEYYRLEMRQKVASIVSTVSEVVPIDQIKVIELVRVFFGFKYSLIYGKTIPVCVVPAYYLSDFFCIRDHFGSDNIDDIIKNGPAYAKACSMYRDLLEGIPKVKRYTNEDYPSAISLNSPVVDPGQLPPIKTDDPLHTV